MNIDNRKKFIINVCYYAIIIAFIYLGTKYILPFLVPFLLGFCIAYLLRKPIQYANKYWHIKYNISAIIFVTLFYIIIGLSVTCIGLGAIWGVKSFIIELPALYTTYAEEVIESIFNTLEYDLTLLGNNAELISMLENLSAEITGMLTSLISTVSSTVMNWVSNLAIGISGFFIKLVLMIISTYFIAIDYNKIIEFSNRQIGTKVSKLINEIKNYLFGTVFVCLKSYIMIMSITFIELAIGLTLIGVDNSVIIALLISIFDILPVLGTGGIMIPWSIISLITGDVRLGILLAIVYIVVTVIRNIIEPKIVGQQLGLHPLVTLVSMFIGVNIAGIVGLFGFPILLSLLVHLNSKGVISLYKVD